MLKTEGGITKYVRNKFWGISIEKLGIFFFQKPSHQPFIYKLDYDSGSKRGFQPLSSIIIMTKDSD